MQGHHGVLKCLCFYIILNLYTMASFAYDEADLYFQTRYQGISTNITTARNANSSGWNVAGLGFLDREKFVFKITLGTPDTLTEPGSDEFYAIYAEYSTPMVRSGTYGVGFGLVNNGPGETGYAHPYIGYSREFLNLLSLGASYGYALELPVDKVPWTNSIEQIGLMFNLFNDYIHLGESLKNSGNFANIESARTGIALIIPISTNSSIILRGDLDISLRNKAGERRLYNLYFGEEIVTKYLSIGVGINKNPSPGKRDSPRRSSVEVAIRISSDNKRPHTIGLDSVVTWHKDQYLLANSLSRSGGESVRGRRYMRNAEKLVEKHHLKEAAESFEKAEQLLLKKDNKEKAAKGRLEAINTLVEHELHFKRGFEYYIKAEYALTIRELEQIPYWSEFYDSAKSLLEASKKREEEKQIQLTKAKKEEMNRLGTNQYIDRQFDNAYYIFTELVKIDPDYHNARLKAYICKGLAEAAAYFKRSEYDATVEACDQILKQYPNAPMVNALKYKAKGYIEYNNDNISQAINFWNMALKMENEAGATIDDSITKKINEAERRLVILQNTKIEDTARRLIEAGKYSEAISMLNQIPDYGPALAFIELAKKKLEISQIYEQAIRDYQSKRYMEAERKFLKCLELDPGHTEAMRKLVMLYNGLLNEAMRDYPEIYMDTEGEVAKKLEFDLNKIVSSKYADPRDITDAYILLGGIYVRVFKDRTKAEEKFIKALKINPNCSIPEVLNYTDVRETFRSAKQKFLSIRE